MSEALELKAPRRRSGPSGPLNQSLDSSGVGDLSMSDTMEFDAKSRLLGVSFVTIVAVSVKKAHT